MNAQQPEIDNLLHQLAQPSINPFAIADLTARLQKLLLARWFDQHPIEPAEPAPTVNSAQIMAAVWGATSQYVENKET